MLSNDTNFVIFKLVTDKLTAEEFSQQLRTKFAIYIGNHRGDNSFRLVTHYYITKDAVATIVNAFKQLLLDWSTITIIIQSLNNKWAAQSQKKKFEGSCINR